MKKIFLILTLIMFFILIGFFIYRKEGSISVSTKYQQEVQELLTQLMLYKQQNILPPEELSTKITSIAKKVLIPKSEDGDLYAMAYLGLLYMLQEKYDLAEKYLRLSAEGGNAYGQLHLANLYEKLGNKDDQVEFYLKKAVAQENKAAALKLALLYERKKEYDLALETIEKALMFFGKDADKSNQYKTFLTVKENIERNKLQAKKN